MEIKEQFGDFLRRLRKSKGFKSQKEFSEATGVSQASISRIEDNSQTPTPDTLKVFSKVLNFSYADLMVKAGYWDEGDLLGDYAEYKEDNKRLLKEDVASYFVDSLALDDEKLLDKFQLTLDGRPLTGEEAKGIIAYLRSLRSLKK
jgi:transcriptional regulator with XRE-family HTH domain